MNDTNKTLAFVAAAAVALGAAWIGKPTAIGTDTPDKVGTILFPELTDARQAHSMEITEFNATSGVREFEVKQKDGLWVLPSHQDYPADAEDNLKEAATALVDLRVINEASEKKSDHATFGVIRPDPDESQIGDEGIGKLVTMKDETGQVLAELIIGKEVQGQEGQRYVRAGNLDQVFVVAIDPSKMSTKFEDWVERDVLDLNGFDIQKLTVQDYSINQSFNPLSGELRITEEPRLQMSVAFSDNDWQLESLEEFRGGEMQPTELLVGEVLDSDALNTMKETLDDLKIVDVEAKPSGLVAGEVTSAGAWMDGAGIQTLVDNGFYPTQSQSGDIVIRSSDGEVQCATKDGVVYTLWFGEVAGIETQNEDNSLNRYVMIQASVDESAFEKPVLELTEDEMASATTSDESAATEGDADDDAAATEAATETDEEQAGSEPVATENGQEADESADESRVDAEDESAADDGATDDGATDDGATDDGTGDEDTSDGDTSDGDQADETSGDDNGSEVVAAEEAEGTEQDTADNDSTNELEAPAPLSDSADDGDAEGMSTDEADDTVTAERDRKLKQYDREMDEYNEKIKQAQEKADALNFRFAEWYYVVSEDEYRKIHLSRSDIVTESEEAAAEGDDVDAFRMLEDGGLSREEAPE